MKIEMPTTCDDCEDVFDLNEMLDCRSCDPYGRTLRCRDCYKQHRDEEHGSGTEERK